MVGASRCDASARAAAGGIGFTQSGWQIRCAALRRGRRSAPSLPKRGSFYGRDIALRRPDIAAR
jgi:hypothetical protein